MVKEGTWWPRQISNRKNEWKENVVAANRNEFSGLKGVNSNLHLSEDSSPVDIPHLFGNAEVFVLIQREMNTCRIADKNGKKVF
jgi:hypothetical protein